MKIEFEELAEYRNYRARELQNRGPATRFQHAEYLRQSKIDPLEVAEPEGDRHDVKALIGEGQLHGIPLCQDGAASIVGQFLIPDHQHRMAEIAADHPGVSFNFDCQVGRSTAKVERQRVRSPQKIEQLADREPAPSLIDIERQDMVEPVITGRNLGKHRPDGKVFAGGIEIGTWFLGLHTALLANCLADAPTKDDCCHGVGFQQLLCQTLQFRRRHCFESRFDRQWVIAGE